MKAAVLVAPPVARMDCSAISRIECPGLILAGQMDAYGPPGKVQELVGDKENLRIEAIAGAGHFFTKGLGQVGLLVREWLAQLR